MQKNLQKEWHMLAYVIFFLYLCARFVNKMEILIAIGAVLVAMVLLSVGVILRKDHRFRSQHIAENARMKQDKIHCATSQDREARRTSRMDVSDL